MGMEIKVGNMDEMCDLMCDNKVPDKQKWYIFTFGCGQENAGKYVKIWGTFNEARQKMFDRYGDRWAFQYSAEDWEKMKADKRRDYYIETEELEVIK